MSQLFLALLASTVVVTAVTTMSLAGELHDAVRARDVVRVQSILASGDAIDESDFTLGTPLHVAISAGDSDIVFLLLDGGADIEAVSELQGSRPLHLAVELGEVEIASALIERGAQVDSLDSNLATPLHRAAAEGHASIVALLLDVGADLQLRDGETGGTPLHYAAMNGHLEASKTLVKRGAPINAADTAGYTPLWLAATPPSLGNVGDASLIEFLVLSGADLGVRDKSGFTPLEYARARGGYAPWRSIVDVLEHVIGAQESELDN